MLAPLLLSLGHAPKEGPALPAFTSAVFQDAVRAVEASLDASDYARATQLAESLPKRNFTLYFDDSRVPADEREQFRQAAEEAMSNWGSLRKIDAKSPDIVISFAPALAVDSLMGGPANIAAFFSQTPGRPRLSATLGLRRAGPERDASAKDVFNDVRYAIGAYLGLASHHFGHYLMDPISPLDQVRSIWPVEHKAAVAALVLADQLRLAVAEHQSLGLSGRPHIAIGADRFTGDALQGDQMEIPIPVTNSGGGTLMMDAVGDCACVVPESAPELAPGGKGTVQVRVDTKTITGPIDHDIYVITNDPDDLIHTSTIHLNVTPRYRVLMPDGDTWIAGEKGKEGDAYLALANGFDAKLIDARIIGSFGGKVTFEPWKGVLADPELNQPALPRRGYHIHISMTNAVLPGRYPMSLSLLTNDPVYPGVSQTIYVQRGIVALPEELPLDVGRKPKSFTVLLSRPGKPFGVLSATSDVKSVQVATRPGDRPGEIKLDVKYDGSAPHGDLAGSITVKTDDPGQPTIKVRLIGSVQ